MNRKSSQDLPQIKSFSNFIESARSVPLALAQQGHDNSNNHPVFKKNKSIILNPEAKSTVLARSNSNNRVSTSQLLHKDSNHFDSNQVVLTVKEKMAHYREKIQQNQRRLEQLKSSRIAKNESKKVANQLKPTKTASKNLFLSKEAQKAPFEKECSKLFQTEDLTLLDLIKTSSVKSETASSSNSEILSLDFQGRKENFEIIKFLDQGAFGKVHLASHPKTGLILCIKTIIKASLNEEILNRLIQEIKIQSSLSHPNILNLYGYTADAEKVYLLLEPCLGSNAYKRLNKKPMPEKEVKKHIKEICSAVEYLHKRDIIHRDIKAENILFHENTAKLCDFGWAVHAPMLRNTQCGTPLYTPPEIVKNEYYDSKVDLWCVGVLTYEMLYGTSPFEIRSIWDLAKIVEEKVFFSKEINISESAQEFVDKCLSKTPSNRLNIRQALQHEFLMSKIEHFRHTLA